MEYYKPATVQRIVVFGLIATAASLLFVFLFRSLLVPFFLALFIAYVLFPMMLTIETRLKITRIWSVLAILIVVSLVIAGAVAVLIPVIKMEIDAIISMIPQAKVYVVSTMLPWLREIDGKLGMDIDSLLTFENLSGYLGSASEAVRNVFSKTSSILGSVINALLIPLFLFFILLNGERLIAFFSSLIPPDIFTPVWSFVLSVDNTLRAVLKRQLTVSAILAVLYCIGFSIVGLQLSLAVGIITGLCRMIPYGDVIVGLFLSFVVIVTDPQITWAVPVGVACVILFVQAIDGMLITPRVIGDKVGLHPAVVIAAVIAFADWMGFVGVLIAIPVAAVLKILLSNSLTAYYQSRFYKLE